MRPKKKLLEALRGLVLSPPQGTAYRLTSVQYMTSPLATTGALKTGGRYNKKGQFAALYLADTPATALAEEQMLKLTDHRLIGVKGPPKVLVSIDYHLQTVLDLNDLRVQAALGTDLEELRAEWVLKQQRGQHIPTQDLGEAVYELGSVEALWVPSARLAGASSLVVFPD
ncbi:RES family NAD+ phosphorylase [uncultured Meiothermus sp.]|uniref:RES family NAD+ phosphorylase n=1 Tax=uncultured Meiothermus sp. TaxID=157471 RepID=UPI00261AA700|nr:RES family NAD+ phosphorylase [uncultured Meiothermus sp.]